MKAQKGETYSSILPFTSVLDGGGSQRHASASLPQEERPGIHFTEDSWALQPVSTDAKSLASIGIRSPDRTSHTEPNHLQLQ